MIVPDWLHRQATIRPRELALATPGAPPMTFGQLEERVDRLHRRLRTLGVGRGDRVASLLTNGVPLVELVHAVARAGAALAPLDPRLTAAEAAALAGLVHPRLIVAEPDTAAAANEVAAASGAEPCLCIPDIDPLAGVEPAGDVPPATLDLDAPHTIIFTSGTSGGAPKAVVLTAGNHLWSAVGSAALLGAHRHDRWLACMPLHHVGGLAIVLRSAILGPGVVLHRRFDAHFSEQRF